MITITVLAIIEPAVKPVSQFSKMMNERLLGFASGLRKALDTKLADTRDCEDLVVYISYNNKYTVRWKIVNDVPSLVESEVAVQCAKLGYITWNNNETYPTK